MLNMGLTENGKWRRTAAVYTDGRGAGKNSVAKSGVFVLYILSQNDRRKEEVETMTLYEVTYEEAGEMKSDLIEAPGPVEAGNLFQQVNRERQIVVVCVVRQ